MSFINVDFYSESLKRVVPFSVIYPNDIPKEMVASNENYQRPMKTLFLLHGYSGNKDSWLFGSPIVELANKFNIAVVLPTCENSFYVDSKGVGKAYGTYVGKELVEYVGKTFNISTKYEDLFIAGFSMGGFGAINVGLKYNNTFAKIAALSSALIIHNIKGIKPGFVNHVADYDYYYSVFGDLDNVVDSDKNPEFLVKKILEQNDTMPKMLIACGTEDFLINENRIFNNFLIKNKVEHSYFESKGTHDFVFWNEYLEKSIRWFLEIQE